MRITPRGIIALLLLAAMPARASVPLRWDATGHLLVPVYVNGTGPYPFMLDTGADVSAAYHWFAVAHALPKGHRQELSGAVGNEAEMTTVIGRLALDGREIQHVDADTIPDRPDGAKITGIAGVDLMTDRLTVLDTGCETAELLPAKTDPEKVAGAHATLVNAGSIRDGKQLTLPVWLDGAKGVGILDSGARSTIINRNFARAAKLNPDSPSFKEGPPVRGATQQSVPSRIGPIGTVRFAGLARNGAVARIADLPVFAEAGLSAGPVMNIGLDLLHDTRITIDYRHRKFWLARSACGK